MITKRLALRDCRRLWKYLSQTGERCKYDAIIHLYSKGLLSQKSYRNHCPLCEKYYNSEKWPLCSKCVWPTANDDGHKTDDVQCRNVNSPYCKWQILSNQFTVSAKRKKAALEVYNLVKTFK